MHVSVVKSLFAWRQSRPYCSRPSPAKQRLQFGREISCPSFVLLEEKVDGLDEGFEVIEEGYSQMATKGAITELEGRLSRVEKKLDVLTSMLGKLETVEKLAKQAVGMEKKLDKALEAIVKFEAKNSSTENNLDVEATRKTTKKSARNQKANGSNAEVEAK